MNLNYDTEHTNFKYMNKLVKGEHVNGLPQKKIFRVHRFSACLKGNRQKALTSQLSYIIQLIHLYSYYTWTCLDQLMC